MYFPEFCWLLGLSESRLLRYLRPGQPSLALGLQSGRPLLSSPPSSLLLLLDEEFRVLRGCTNKDLTPPF